MSSGFHLETLVLLQQEADRCGYRLVYSQRRGAVIAEVQMIRPDGTVALTATLEP